MISISGRKLSLAEISRRGIELFLDRFPPAGAPQGQWQLPKVRGGGIKVPLETLHDIAAGEEENRSLDRR